MIHLVCNGRREAVDAAGELRLDAVLAEGLPPGEVAVRVTIDERALSDEELGGAASISVAEGSEIYVETRSVADVARSALGGASDYAGRVSRALAQAGELLRAGQVEAGADLIADASDALSVLTFTLTGAAPHVGPHGAALEKASAELAPWLEELVQAQEGLDWIRAADCLEYELAPRLATWSDLCRDASGEHQETNHGV